MVEPELICIVSSACGIYVPQVFAERYSGYINLDQAYILTMGPECEGYWDTWAEVLDNCKVKGCTLYQGEDGDIFLVPEGYYVNEWGELEAEEEFVSLLELIEKINWN